MVAVDVFDAPETCRKVWPRLLTGVALELPTGALARVAPGVPLIGPVVANPRRDLSWVSTLLDAPHEGLGMVSVHRYPYSACARRRWRPGASR